MGRRALGHLGGIHPIRGGEFSLLAHTGQSLAKMMLGMRIVTLDGNIPSVGNIVLLRSGLAVFLINLPGIGNLISFVDALLIFRAEHNTLHDDIAKTRVIRIRKDKEVTDV